MVLLAYQRTNIGSIAMKAVILLLVVLCLVPSACARDYILEGATTNITVDASGIVHVEESIHIYFKELQ